MPAESYFIVGLKMKVSTMRQKQQDSAQADEERDQVEEQRSLLQTDNIAPVDNANFGKRLAEIIVRASNVMKPWRGR